MSRVVEGVTSGQPLLRLPEGWLQLQGPFVTSIPWKSLGATFRPLGKLICIPRTIPELPFLIQLDIFHLFGRDLWIQPVTGSGGRWAEESPSGGVVGDAPAPALHPLPRHWGLNCSYPDVIHSSPGKVEKNPFISKRTLKCFPRYNL